MSRLQLEHKDVPEMMARLSRIGLEKWSAGQNRKWICAACGHEYDWFLRLCPGCGAVVGEG